MVISHKDFFTILRVNGALFAKTARAISKQYGIDYSRQAVRERALKHPEELADIDDEMLDFAEARIFSLMRSDNPGVSFRATKFYLMTKGKKRGYHYKPELDTHNNNGINSKVVFYIPEKGRDPGLCETTRG